MTDGIGGGGGNGSGTARRGKAGRARTVLGFALFGIAAVSIVAGTHALVYFTTVRFLGIADGRARVAIAIALAALAFSFPVSAALVHLKPCWVTNFLITASMTWVGLLIYLVIASALVWAVFGVAHAGGWGWDMGLVCAAAFGAALAMTGFGVVSASSPELRRIDVAIEGLPGAWKGKTVVHLSDLHLGSTRGAGYMRRVADEVRAIDPEVVLITGDLFDGMGGDFEEVLGPLDELTARKGVFFATGNHEGYLGLARPLAALARTEIRVLRGEVVDVDGLQIVGIGFPEHDRQGEAVEEARRVGEAIDPDRPSILLYHTPTNVGTSGGDRAEQQVRTYWRPDVDFSYARDHGIDLQLSGHTHAGQFWPFTILTRWIWRGFDSGLNRVGKLSIYTSSGTGTWGPPLRSGCRSEIVAITLR